MLSGSFNVEQKILRQYQLYKVIRGIAWLSRIHSLPHDPCQHSHEGNSSPRYCSIPHHHECTSLSGKWGGETFFLMSSEESSTQFLSMGKS